MRNTIVIISALAFIAHGRAGADARQRRGIGGARIGAGSVLLRAREAVAGALHRPLDEPRTSVIDGWCVRPRDGLEEISRAVDRRGIGSAGLSGTVAEPRRDPATWRQQRGNRPQRVQTTEDGV